MCKNTKIAAVGFIFISMSLLFSLSSASNDKPDMTIVDEFKCEDKTITIKNYKFDNEVNNVINKRLGAYLGVWVAYHASGYYGESNAYFMVNKETCEKYSIDGENIEFFDKNTFLTWSWDFESGYFPNQISMYEIVNYEIRKYDEFIPQEGGPSDAKWVDKNKIKFKLLQFNPDKSADKVYIYTDRTIVKHGNKWIYEN